MWQAPGGIALVFLHGVAHATYGAMLAPPPPAAHGATPHGNPLRFDGKQLCVCMSSSQRPMQRRINDLFRESLGVAPPGGIALVFLYGVAHAIYGAMLAPPLPSAHGASPHGYFVEI